MAEQLNVDLIVKATAQGFDKVGRDMGSIGGTAKATKQYFLDAGASMVKALAGIGAGLTAAGLIAKQFYGIIGEGAALNRSAQMFDNLTVSIGSTADVMLGKLRTATSGMVSDAQLIAGAGQIISLGLADTEDGVVRLATLVSKLGWDMQQVIMTFANNSVMRLDALGLSVEDVTSKAKALEAQGYSTDKAFDMAVIQAGEEKLRLLGDAADSTVGDMDRLETSIANVTDAAKKLIAIQWSPIVGGMSDVLTTIGPIFDEMDRALAQGLISAEEHQHLVTRATLGIEKYQERLRNVRDNLRTLNFGDELAHIGAAAHSMELSAAEQALRDYGNEMERLAITARATAESQQAFDAMLYPDGVDAYNMALARQEKWLAAVAAGYTTAAGAIDAMRAAQVAAQEAQRTALGGEFAGAFDTTGMSEASRIMLETAANAGTAAEQLYVLAGGGQAAGEAMMQAAVNVRAAQLGELLAAGLITAKQAAQDLQDFADNLNLEDMFSADKILPGTTSPESLRDRLLGPAEGLVSAVSDTVTAATEPATNAIDELIKSLDEADQMDPEIIVDDETITSATGNVTGLFDALVSLTDRDWVVNVVYQTSGTIPGATNGATGADNGAAPSGNAPAGDTTGGGGGGGGRGRHGADTAPTSSTVVNNFMNGVTQAAMAAAIAQGITRYTRSTR